MDRLNINRVQQYRADVAFKTLAEGVDDNLYFIPKYQRKFRWKKEQVQELIRSLVKGYPIPPIYAYRNRDGQLEILDGQQRVMSLFFYYIGKFIDQRHESSVDYQRLNIEGKKFGEVLEETYRLTDMETFLEDGREGEEQFNISYSRLPVDFKRKLDYTTIPVVELRWDDMESRAVDLQTIFKNLNANGTQLSPQEIRNGIYNCAFYDMLRTLNHSDEKWKQIRGKESDDERDMEFLLRLCTVKKYVSYRNGEFMISEYAGKYADWMDRFSELARDMKKEEIEDYRKSLQLFFRIFDNTKVLGMTKISLLESIYAVTQKTDIKVKITQDIVEEILAAQEYKDSSRQGTVKKAKMNERWKGVYKILQKYAE